MLERRYKVHCDLITQALPKVKPQPNDDVGECKYSRENKSMNFNSIGSTSRTNTSLVSGPGEYSWTGGDTKNSFLIFSFFFTFYFILQLINNVMLVSDVQQSDSVIHIHVCILFQIISPIRLLQNSEQRSLCHTLQVFVSYPF